MRIIENGNPPDPCYLCFHFFYVDISVFFNRYSNRIQGLIFY